MKITLTCALLFFCVLAQGQGEIMPQKIESAFKEKYPVTKIGDWWVENELFYLEFNFKGNSYTSVFDKAGTWKETSEIISEMDIPQLLLDYLRDTFPSGKISYCEKVETNEVEKYLRVNLFDSNNILQVIRSDQNGRNITIQKSDSNQS